MKSAPNPWLLSAIAPLVMVVAACLGSTTLDMTAIFSPESTDYHIFWNLRAPRVLVAFLAGSGLALCGMSFQALFLNTLATPYTLGVAGGASCGAAVVIYLGGLPGLAVGPSVSAGACGGAALAMVLVLGFSRTRMGHQRHVMLLAGVAVSFFFSSLLLLIQAMSSIYQSFHILRWLMGGISVAGYGEVRLLAPPLLLGIAFLFWYRNQLNMMLLGDALAHTRGLDIRRTKQVLFVVVSIMTAMIVSITGPIGFVGLVVPHVCRMIWGGDHRRLMTACLWVGGILLVVCDLIARVVLAPSGVPVGVITSLIGAPFFFWLLLRSRYRF